MNQWDSSSSSSSSSSSVSPAAVLLSRCVSVGAVSQEDVDAAFSDSSPALSPHLQQAEEQIRMQRQLGQLQLQVELLKVEKKSADVSHSFHLTGRLQMLQMLGEHLQELLRNQKSVRQRLTRPLDQTSLPVQAHLHRVVVESLQLMMDFIQSLEEKLSSAHDNASTAEQLILLNTSLAQLLDQSAEMEILSNQLLQKTVDTSRVTSDPTGPSSSSSCRTEAFDL